MHEDRPPFFDFGNLSTGEKLLALAVGVGIMFISPRVQKSLPKVKTKKASSKRKTAPKPKLKPITPYRAKDFETVAVIDGKTGEVIGSEEK
jgi:hypothetical protein